MATAKNKDDVQTRKTLYLVAFIFMIIACVSVGWFILPLAWLIPMTIITKKAMDQTGTSEEKGHLALGICSIFFCGVVAGILTTIASSLYEN